MNEPQVGSAVICNEAIGFVVKVDGNKLVLNTLQGQRTLNLSAYQVTIASAVEVAQQTSIQLRKRVMGNAV